MSRAVAMVMLTSSIALASDPKSREESRQHEEHAHALVGEMAFREAITDYLRANELAPSPIYLYNIGYLHFRLGQILPAPHSLPDKRAAIAYLKRYLAEMPSAPDRELVQGYVRKTEQEVPQLEQMEAEALRKSEARARETEAMEERVRVAEATARASDRQRADEHAARLRVEEEARKQRERVKLGLTIAGAGLGLAIVGATGVGVGISEYETAKSIPNVNKDLGAVEGSVLWTTFGGVATGLGVAAIIVGAIVAAPTRSALSMGISGAPGSANVTLSGAF